MIFFLKGKCALVPPKLRGWRHHNKTLHMQGFLFLSRDLNRLKNEIEAYQKEENIWKVDQDISNCGGNLALHLIGNLNTFIGAELGKTGYIRQRDLEFSLKNVPREELISQIEDTLRIVDQTLEKLSPEELEKEYPLLVLPEKTSTGFFLTYLTTHLAYHLGQVNYHRRLLDNR